MDPTPINSTSSKDDDNVTIITSNRSTNVSSRECVGEHSKVRRISQSPVQTTRNVPVHFGSKVRHVSQSPIELPQQQPHFPRKRLTNSQVRPLIAMATHTLFGSPMPQYLNALTIATNQAIANTGATSIFIMEGVDADNKRPATVPLTINLPDGKRVQLTHVCDIRIPGLPTVLTGHIVPSLCIASLIGIRPLCKAGCKVIFDNKKCDVVFDRVVILRGFKDPSTNLWTLPIPTKVCTAPGLTVLPQPGPCKSCAPHLPMDTSDTHTGVTLATFTHPVQTRANAVKFAHQSLCNPKISTLLKAIHQGFLKGCPNLLETLISQSQFGHSQGSHETPAPRTPKHMTKTEEWNDNSAGAHPTNSAPSLASFCAQRHPSLPRPGTRCATGP